MQDGRECAAAVALGATFALDRGPEWMLFLKGSLKVCAVRSRVPGRLCPEQPFPAYENSFHLWDPRPASSRQFCTSHLGGRGGCIQAAMAQHRLSRTCLILKGRPSKCSIEISGIAAQRECIWGHIMAGRPLTAQYSPESIALHGRRRHLSIRTVSPDTTA